MRFTLSFFFILPFLVFSQKNQDQKILGYGIDANVNYLDKSSISYSEFKALAVDTDFFPDQLPTAQHLTAKNIQNRFGIAANIVLKGMNKMSLGPVKRSRFNLGVSYMQGGSYSFNFSEYNSIRYDTIIISSSLGTIEKKYRDSIYWNYTSYATFTRNIGFFGEYLMYTAEGWPSFSTGLGISADMSMNYVIRMNQEESYQIAIYNENEQFLYYDNLVDQEADQFNGTYPTEQIYQGSENEVEAKRSFFIRPYIPIRIESPITNKEHFSHITMHIQAKLGAELHLTPSVGVNTRMFYAVGVGFNYYL